MKILVIHSTEKVSGGEIVSLEVIEGLKNQYDFFIFLPQRPKEDLLKQYFKEKNLIYPSKKSFILLIKTIRKILKEGDFKILHCHGTRAAFWSRLAVIGLKNKPKIVYTLHGFHLPRRNFWVRRFLLILERFLNRWTDVLVCVSEADKKLVLQYKTILPEKIKVIKNGIDVEKFQVDENLVEREKEKLGLTDKFVLTSIGRLHPQKDFSTVLRALKLIVPQIQNVKLLIVGDGPLRESLEKEAKSLGLNEYVKFLGWRKDTPVLINVSDIIILSTHWEGLPLGPLEAGASKKPIVASGVEGVREVVKDGETGFLFKPKSVEDLADKILKLYQDEKLRQRLGEQGFNYVSKYFSKERMIEEYKSLYNSLLICFFLNTFGIL